MNMPFEQFVSLVRKYATGIVRVNLREGTIVLIENIEHGSEATGYEMLEMSLLPVLEQIIPTITCLQLLKLRKTYARYEREENGDDYGCDLHELHHLMMGFLKDEADMSILNLLDGRITTNDVILPFMLCFEKVAKVVKDANGKRTIVIDNRDALTNREKQTPMVEFFRMHLGENYTRYIPDIVANGMVSMHYGLARNNRVDADVMANYFISLLSKRMNAY